MQRSKASGSVEVKRVIGALCRLLAATGLDPVPAPEAFRRAKFGGGVEVESQFWQLLASVLQRTGAVSCDAGAGARRSEDAAVDQHGPQLRTPVTAGLWRSGFHGDWMYERDERDERGERGERGEGGSPSGRDLLLALGWLLGAGALEKLVTRRAQQLDTTLLASAPDAIAAAAAPRGQADARLQLGSASLRRLQWLVGHLRHRGRILLSMLDERSRLLHAVLSASAASSPSSDGSSAALHHDCVRVQQLCDVLEAYLTWRQVEDVFWTWMDSVVDCHLTDPAVKKSTRTTGVCNHGNQRLEKPLSGQTGRRTGGGDAEDGGGGRAQGGSGAPPLARLPPPPPLSRAPRVRLQAGRGGTPGELAASEAALLLLRTEEALRDGRDGRRRSNRTLLQDVTGGLDRLVLIPPQTF